MPGSEFWVLLGADYAGKSSVLSALARRTGWRIASYDDDVLGGAYPLVSRLRTEFLTEALSEAGRRYSADFVLSIVQTAVVFLRDQVLAGDPTRPVLVDSYYYKILAKCRLSGLANEQIFAWWRSFPAPRGVVYLDTDAGVAWRRAGNGAAVNRFEHYGDRPSREAFVRFQTDLRRLMLAEVRDVPTRVIGTAADVGDIARQIEEFVRSDRDHRSGDRRTGRPVPA
ncbi:hypothetical protein [Couchioplanes azureus]|uniref:hypothetical protein n=1 Tax=Couchioplanes caeruleus TaxID=56438 RepID=UPI00166FB298|nr:hypothetical protein [Couchioplanes caeruleus]GGQ71679.1 hypothetical protein GCM10010166_47280 [Couchioplanes caeruleus subsp. azureus]